MSKLSPRAVLFAQEFVKDRNKTQAAIRAGYSVKGAHVTAIRLLQNTTIAKMVEDKALRIADRMEVSVARILQERARLAFFDPRKLLDNTGKPLPLQDLDDDTAAAIAGLDVQDLYEMVGDSRENVGTVVKYKLADKNASLTALEKHLGMYQEEQKQEAALNIFIHLEK